MPLAAALTALCAGLWLVPGAAAAEQGPGLRLPRPASEDMSRVDDLYWMLVVVSLIVLAFVAVPLVLFVVRYRSRGRDRSVEGPQIRGNTRLELAWTLGPVLIVAAIIAFTLFKLPGIESVRADGPDENAVRVEGRLFYWRFEYPNGATSFDRLRLPAGEATDLEITAPDSDVIHSFWVPRLHGKVDAIPGRANLVRFRPDRPGLFNGVCAEFCGIQHAAMRLVVEVMEPEAYRAWLEEEGDRAAAERGAEIWGAVCAKCHGVGFVQGAIPLDGNTLLLRRESLEPLVREGRRTMPAVGQGWSEQELAALLAYARTVGERPAQGAGGG
jgi:cytochrome c oxidase subunit 2